MESKGKEKEQLLTELESIVEQLRAAKQEMSATMAGDLLYGLGGSAGVMGKKRRGLGVRKWVG
ncbi:MAG: hypothetical protein ACXVC5_09125, partial [Tumebacillaceae bacterium]